MSGSILPYAAAARVADAKVRDFILDAAHPDNKGRAAFYIGIGFTRQQWHLLRDALLAHPQNNSVIGAVSTEFGTKYRVRCSIASPDGRNPCIDTLWVIDHGSTVPASMTTYPAPRSVRQATTPQ
jgi:hypothetical protein